MMISSTRIFSILFVIGLICSITPTTALEMSSVENSNLLVSEKGKVEYTDSLYQHTKIMEKINKKPGKINKNTSENKSNIINNTDNSTVPDKTPFFTTDTIITTGLIIVLILMLVIIGIYWYKSYLAKVALMKATSLNEAGPLESALFKEATALESAAEATKSLESAAEAELKSAAIKSADALRTASIESEALRTTVLETAESLETKEGGLLVLNTMTRKEAGVLMNAKREADEIRRLVELRIERIWSLKRVSAERVVLEATKLRALGLRAAEMRKVVIMGISPELKALEPAARESINLII